MNGFTLPRRLTFVVDAGGWTMLLVAIALLAYSLSRQSWALLIQSGLLLVAGAGLIVLGGLARAMFAFLAQRLSQDRRPAS